MIQSPYQQNIDIIKGFFKKPIVLILSIFTFLSVVVHFAGQFAINPVIISKQLQQFNVPADYANVEYTATINPLSINIFTILSAIIFLLFYVLSKNETNNLSVPSMMFKVISIITLVLSVLSVLLIFGFVLVFGLFLGAFSRTDSGFSPEVFTLVVFVASIVLLPFCVLLILNAVSQLLFANSVRNSLNSIYLKKSGAVFYGIICFIFTAITIALYIFAAVYLLHLSSQYSAVNFSLPHILFLFVQCAVDIATGIVTGILAIKYAVYIKNISQKYRISTDAPPENEQQPVQNYSEPEVQINDANNFNPYDNAQIPVYEPPQAPVQENFANQFPVEENNNAQNPTPQPIPVEENINAQNPTAQPIPEPIAPVQEPQPAPADEQPPVAQPAPAPVKEDVFKPAENQVPRFCTQCGSPVGPNDYFCNHCGAEIIRN